VPVEEQVAAYLRLLARRASEVLGDALVGVYAGGSVALGAFGEGRSDIDVAVVCRDALPPACRLRLAARLHRETSRCPARGLELVVYRGAVAASGAPEPGFELELNGGPRMAPCVTLDPGLRPPGDGAFWYGIDRSILRAHGRAVVGPPAGDVFVGPGPGDLRRLLVDALRWWDARAALLGEGPAAGTEEAVLGACRALVRHRTGAWLAKAEAGMRLVREGDPDAGLVAAALAARTGAPSPAAPPVRAMLGRVAGEIAGAGLAAR
jgi:hypothetical protein